MSQFLEGNNQIKAIQWLDVNESTDDLLPMKSTLLYQIKTNLNNNKYSLFGCYFLYRYFFKDYIKTQMIPLILQKMGTSNDEIVKQLRTIRFTDIFNHCQCFFYKCGNIFVSIVKAIYS